MMIRWITRIKHSSLLRSVNKYISENISFHEPMRSMKPADDASQTNHRPSFMYAFSDEGWLPKEQSDSSDVGNATADDATSESKTNQLKNNSSVIVQDIRYSLSPISPEDNTDKAKSILKKLSADDSVSAGKTLVRSVTEKSFVEKLLEHIDLKQMKDSDVYKAAMVDRRLFSRMVSDPSYRPSKDTCVALCMALNLDLEDTNDMLERAGYALSHSMKRDLIIEYFIKEHIYDIDTLNEVLYSLKHRTLGRV